MSRIRLLLAWLLLAALPIQGFAAASMLFCGMERAAVSQAAVDGQRGHDSGSAAPAAAARDMAASMADGMRPDDQATASPDAGKVARGDQGMQGHGCSVCALSCQVVAIVGLDPGSQTSPSQSAKPTSPVARVATRATTVPDKPPRA